VTNIHNCRLSDEGFSRVERARQAKGWRKQDPRWLEAANVDVSTLKRFRVERKSITDFCFARLCGAVGIDDWETLVDRNPVSEPEPKTRIDWGDAPDVPILFGRTEKLRELEQWILKERCRIVSILGIGAIGKTQLSIALGRGGIGKTDLSVKLAKGIQDEFDYVIWRSLVNAPKPEKILSEWIKLISDSKDVDLADSIDDLLLELISCLNKKRCLLILDNVETILRGGEDLGDYREGYEDFGLLFNRIGTAPHESCLLITSRENPKDIDKLDGNSFPVRRCLLEGLDQLSAREIFGQVGAFEGSDENWELLNEYYGGNPLALELVARLIEEDYQGNISYFLGNGDKLDIKDFNDMLDWHFDRLSDEEIEIAYWLTINREPTSKSDLEQDVIARSNKRLGGVIRTLKKRIPLEETSLQNEESYEEKSYTLQPVLIEYLTKRLIEQVKNEISTENVKDLKIFNSHALLKALARDYVREAQVNLLVKPIIDEIVSHLGSYKKLESVLVQIIANMQNEFPLKPGYTGGNVLNLLRQSETSLDRLDFSYLDIRQAYLQGMELHNVSFCHSSFSNSTFTKTISSIAALAFSPNGQLIAATGERTGEICFWRASDSQLSFICEGHKSLVNSVVFSPDGQFLASGSDDKTIRIWDIDNGQCISTLEGHDSAVLAIDFHRNNCLIASGSQDHNIKIWNIINKDCRQTLRGHENWVQSVAFSPDGNLLASGSEDNTVKIWDVETGQCIQTLSGHTAGIWSATFCSSDSRVVASGSEDYSIKIWDIQTGQCLKTLEGHTNWVRALSFDPNRQILASSSEDATIRIWDLNTGSCLKTLQGHISWIHSISFSPDGKVLASGSSDHTIRLWNVLQGQCERTLVGYVNWIWTVAFGPDSQTLASAGEDCAIRLWNVHTHKCLRVISGHTRRIWSVAFSPSSLILASGSEDCTIKLWDVRSGRCEKTLKGHDGWVRSVAFSPDGQFLASGSEDYTVRVWCTTSGQCLKTLKGHTQWVPSVAFSPDGTLLASGSGDQTIRIWDVREERCLKVWEAQNKRVSSVSFSSDGRFVVSGGGSGDQTMKLWEVSTGQCLKSAKCHRERISDIPVAFSPDDQTIVSTSDEFTMTIWGTETLQARISLRGHSNSIEAIAFSPNGQMLASGSSDETVRIWDAKTGECLGTLKPLKPYEGMNITGTTGLTDAQKIDLIALGAVEN
jgi:WD40 repeat protein